LDQCCGSTRIHTPQSQSLCKVYLRRCSEDSTKGYGRLGEEVYQGHGPQATPRICLCPFLNPDTTLLVSNLSDSLWPAMIPPFSHQGYPTASGQPRVQGKENRILRHKCARHKRSYNLASTHQLTPGLHRQQNKHSNFPHRKRVYKCSLSVYVMTVSTLVHKMGYKQHFLFVFFPVFPPFGRFYPISSASQGN
jgi:hypothetical protein